MDENIDYGENFPKMIDGRMWYQRRRFHKKDSAGKK